MAPTNAIRGPNKPLTTVNTLDSIFESVPPATPVWVNAAAILVKSFLIPKNSVPPNIAFPTVPNSLIPLITPIKPLAIVIRPSINFETKGKNISPIC